MRLLALSVWTQAEPFGHELWTLRQPLLEDDPTDSGLPAGFTCATEEIRRCLGVISQPQDGSQGLSLFVRVVPMLLDSAALLACFIDALAAIGNSGHAIYAVRLYVSDTVGTQRALAEICRLMPRALHLRIEGRDPEGRNRSGGDARSGFQFAAASPIRDVATSIELRDAGGHFTNQLADLHGFGSLRSLLVSQANNILPPWHSGRALLNLHTVTLQSIPSFQQLHSWYSANWTQVAPSLREIQLVHVTVSQIAHPVDLSASPDAPALHVGPGVNLNLPTDCVEAGHVHRFALTRTVREAVSNGGHFDPAQLNPELRALFSTYDVKYLLSEQPTRDDGPRVVRTLALDSEGLDLVRWELEEWLPVSPSSELDRLTICLGGTHIEAWLPALVARISAGWRPWQPESTKVRLSLTRPPRTTELGCLMAAAAICIEVLDMGVPIEPMHCVRALEGDSVCIELHVLDDICRRAADLLISHVAARLNVSEILVHIGDVSHGESLCKDLLRTCVATRPLHSLIVSGVVRASDVTSIIAAVNSGALLCCDLRAAHLDIEALLHLSGLDAISSGPSAIVLSEAHFQQMSGTHADRRRFLDALRAILPRAELDGE